MNRRPSKSRADYDDFSQSRTARFTAASPDTHFFEPKKRRPFALRALKAALLVLAAALLGNFAANCFVHVARVSVPVTGLVEEFDGYTLLHISDLKGASFGADQSLVRMALSGESFDAVILTGDMLSARGNAEPLYALISALRALNPSAPIYFIAGDDDPAPFSLSYAAGGSAFAPWVLGAKQRGAQLLSHPVAVERGGQQLWISTYAHLTLDINTMQGQYERQYLDALSGGREIETELYAYHLNSLEHTRAARGQMDADDVFITATHVPPQREDYLAGSLTRQVDLVLSGHYLGGLVRLPLLGAAFIPSQSLPRYGLFPGRGAYYGLDSSQRPCLYASPGLGGGDAHYPAAFFRLFNPPTVTLISLTPSAL